MNTEPTSPPRIPLVSSIDSRLESPSDARIVNAYTEKTTSGDVVVKRPAISTYINLPGGGTGGCYYWNGSVYSIAGWSLYKDGNFISNVGASGGRYSFASCLGSTPKLILHNQFNFYFFDGFSLSFTFAGGHAFLPGVAFLDGTTYCLDGSSIFGSGINDPSTWNPLNVIQAQQEPDFGVAIYKHRQYVIVFKNWTTEAFWDAGNPVGSPLQSAPGTLIEFGCMHSASIQQFEDLLIWASATRSGSVGVMMMENLQPQTISSQAIERLLQSADWTTVYSWSGRINGHRFYGLTIASSNLSLVYDITTQQWFQWTYGADGNYLPFVACTSIPDRRVVLQHENGSLYTLSANAFTDDGQDVVVDIYTPNWDGGTRRRKYLQRLEVLGDQANMRSVKLRWSDDDYQTWSNFRNIDMGQKRPYTEDLGTFYRRAFHLRHNGPTAFRVKALECTNILLGSE
jgi:Phage stabilisation protein.